MKYRIKRRRKTMKTRNIFFALVIGLIFISISYARYNTILRINGTVTGEQEQFSVTYLYFEDSQTFPDEIGYMDTYTYTFTGSPVIQSIIMGQKTLMRDTDYTYTNGTLTIPNVDGNLVIQAEVVGEDVWVTYCFGNENFNGQKYLNTGIPLFSTENVNRDFEISIDLSNFEFLAGQDTNRNVFLCNQNEFTTPYQGFAFHYRDNAIKTQVNVTKVPEVQKLWGKTEGRIVFTRTSNVLYQDGEQVYDFQNLITPFNLPLSIGANLDENGSPRRYSKVTISNITVKLKYTYAEYLGLCQSFPIPSKPSNLFDGWYTSLDGGTKITSTSQMDANGRRLYVHWNNSSTVRVTFLANGGTGTMSPQDILYDTETPLNVNEFTNPGYNFAGWSTNADGTGTRYSDGGNATLTEDLTLYAQWVSAPIEEFTLASATFTGKTNEIVDTGMHLFSSENIHRNFEIYFEIDSIASNNNNQATLMNTKDESGTPYPGIVFRIDQKKYMLKADSTANNTNRDDRALNTVQKVRIIRISDVTYYSINDESYQVLMDFSNIVRTFDAPVSFGGIIKPNGTKQRPLKGTLSNMLVRFISDSATLADYENALPSGE